MLAGVLPASRHFARAIVMPNLVPPVVTGADARGLSRPHPRGAARGAGLHAADDALPDRGHRPGDVAAAAADGLVAAVKLYPAGATTNSQSGVRDIARVMPVLERMAAIGLPLCVHGEVTDPEIDIFDREAVFVERVLAPLRARLPELRIVMEHVTTEEGVAFVEASANVGATITVQHLMLDRNALLVGGIRPHYYCLPVLKRARHRAALRRAATGGDPRFFLGTDSAPHAKATKEAACGCAGCFTAPVALAAYAQVFDEEGALDRLEGFASLNGPAFYRLPPNEARVTLERLAGAGADARRGRDRRRAGGGVRSGPAGDVACEGLKGR